MDLSRACGAYRRQIGVSRTTKLFCGTTTSATSVGYQIGLAQSVAVKPCQIIEVLELFQIQSN